MNTRNSWTLLILAALFLVAAGCLPSLNPIYTPNDLVAADEILGRWRKSDGKDELTFTAVDAAAKTYKLSWKEDDQTAEFEARFVRLGGQLFMDTFPDMDAAKKNLAGYEGHLIPAHFFFRVTLTDAKLKLETLSGDAIKKHAKTLGVVERPNDSIITATTKQLQTLLKRHAHAKTLWTETTDADTYRKQ